MLLVNTYLVVSQRRKKKFSCSEWHVEYLIIRRVVRPGKEGEVCRGKNQIHFLVYLKSLRCFYNSILGWSYKHMSLGALQQNSSDLARFL